jgi:trk system potassium uptake protein TrkA
LKKVGLRFEKERMRIIIAGAGDVGFHLAKLLSYESHEIVVIDLDDEKLKHLSSSLDVATIKGSSTNYATLEEADVNKADLFISVTSFEDTNITSAIFAKHLGAKRTVARVKNDSHLQERERKHLKDLGVDELISTIILASREIGRLLNSAGLTDVFHFEEGKLTLLGMVVDDKSELAGKSLKQTAHLNPDNAFITVAILRNGETIIPHGDTTFEVDDHAYFIATPKGLNQVLALSGQEPCKIKNVMILGGSEIGYNTALKLSKDYNVKLIEQNKERSFELADSLPGVLVVHGDGRDKELLESEGLSKMDAFIAVTGNSETNIISSLLAKQLGVERTVSLVENVDYVHLSQNIGIDTMINRKLIAANFIFRYVREGHVLHVASIHGVDAEVLEFVVSEKSKITSKYLKHQKFPKDALIGGVTRKGKSLIPNGDFRIRANDRVVVLCAKDMIHKVEKFFK